MTNDANHCKTSRWAGAGQQLYREKIFESHIFTTYALQTVPASLPHIWLLWWLSLRSPNYGQDQKHAHKWTKACAQTLFPLCGYSSAVFLFGNVHGFTVMSCTRSLCTWNNFWLAGVVTCGPVQATLFCSHWESQDFFSVNTQNEFEVYRNILADFTLKRICKTMKWVIVLTYLIYDSCFRKSNLDEKPQAVLKLRIRFGEGCCWKAQISAETPTVS